MTPPKYRYRDGSIAGTISIRFEFTDKCILRAIDDLLDVKLKVSKIAIERRIKRNFYDIGNEFFLSSRYPENFMYNLDTLVPYGVKFYPEFFIEPKYKEYVRDKKLDDLLK